MVPGPTVDYKFLTLAHAGKEMRQVSISALSSLQSMASPARRRRTRRSQTPEILTASPPGISGSRSLENPPSSFAYNARVAVALGPCAAFLLDLGGAPVLTTFTLGLMAAHFADWAGFKSGGFLKVLGPLIAAQIVFYFRTFLYLSFRLAALAALLSTLTSFLIGVWASLQFKWIQIKNRSTVIALERLLFVFVPFTASSILTWATVSAVGMINASYCLMAFNCVFYWLFAIPRASSFKSINHGDENLILSPLDSLFLAMNLLFFPLLFHSASHYSVMFSSPAAASDLYLLFFVPFLFMMYVSSRGALWWVTRDSMQLDIIRLSNGSVAMIVVVFCLEIRVLFHYFGREIQVPLSANELLGLIMMLGWTAGFGCSVVAFLCDDEFRFLDFTALAVTSAILVETFVGLPILSIALPAVAGLSLGLFIPKKSVSSDLDFSELNYIALPAFFSWMVWFVIHNYWDQYIWLTGKANIVLVLAIPGSAILPGTGRLNFLAEVGLIIHALFLCHFESCFFNYWGVYIYGIDADTMYPSYMVKLTTLVGLVLVRELLADRIRPQASWILTCLYSSKLAVLFITSKSAVWPYEVLLSAILPPVLVFRDKSRAASEMKPWQSCTHAAAVALSVWFFRETVFEALQWLLGRPPSNGFFLGCCTVCIELACIPIVALHFPHVLPAKGLRVLVVATVLFLSFLMALHLPSMQVPFKNSSEIL